MNSWQDLLRLFYKYTTESILYIEDGKLKGFVPRRAFMEDLSDLSDMKPQLSNFVEQLKNIDQALGHLEKYGFEHENKRVIPVVNKKFEFVGLWSRTDIVKTWEEIPSIKKWDPPTHGSEPHPDPPSREHQKNTNGSSPQINGNEIKLGHKLAMLAMETLPIGMLAVDTSGEELFCNEDWLKLKKKHPAELKTSNIIRGAKDIMAEEAFKEKETSPSMTFELGNIIQNHTIKMRLIRSKNLTVGYLFWRPERLASKPSKSERKVSASYESKNLTEMLAEEEKKILQWAMVKAEGKISSAAKILGIPRQTFGYRYDKYYKK